MSDLTARGRRHCRIDTEHFGSWPVKPFGNKVGYYYNDRVQIGITEAIRYPLAKRCGVDILSHISGKAYVL